MQNAVIYLEESLLGKSLDLLRTTVCKKGRKTVANPYSKEYFLEGRKRRASHLWDMTYVFPQISRSCCVDFDMVRYVRYALERQSPNSSGVSEILLDHAPPRDADSNDVTKSLSKTLLERSTFQSSRGQEEDNS